MCKALEDMLKETVARDRVTHAMKMLKDGISVEKVAEYSGLNVDKVQELVEQERA